MMTHRFLFFGMGLAIAGVGSLAGFALPDYPCGCVRHFSQVFTSGGLTMAGLALVLITAKWLSKISPWPDE